MDLIINSKWRYSLPVDYNNYLCWILWLLIVNSDLDQSLLKWKFIEKSKVTCIIKLIAEIVKELVKHGVEIMEELEKRVIEIVEKLELNKKKKYCTNLEDIFCCMFNEAII